MTAPIGFHFDCWHRSKHWAHFKIFEMNIKFCLNWECRIVSDPFSIKHYQHLPFIHNSLRAILILDRQHQQQEQCFFSMEFSRFCSSFLLTTGSRFAVVICLEYHDNCTCRNYGSHRVSYSLFSFTSGYRHKHFVFNISKIVQHKTWMLCLTIWMRNPGRNKKWQKNIWEIVSFFLSAS